MTEGEQLPAISAIRRELHQRGSVTYEDCERVLGRESAIHGLATMISVGEALADDANDAATVPEDVAKQHEWKPSPHDTYYLNPLGVVPENISVYGEKLAKVRNRQLGRTALIALGGGALTSVAETAVNSGASIVVLGGSIAASLVSSRGFFQHTWMQIRYFKAGYLRESNSQVYRGRFNKRKGPGGFGF